MRHGCILRYASKRGCGLLRGVVKGHMRWRAVFGLCVLAPQVVLICSARFHPMRYFCWAPYDTQIEYRISAKVNGQPLSPVEIERRYRHPAEDVNPRMICQITDVIAHAEKNYHPTDNAVVKVEYRTNGGPVQEWSWPLTPHD